MKSMKKTTYLVAITLVIAGLMITSATSMPVTSDSKETQTEETVQCVWVPCQLVNAVKRDNTPSGAAPLFAGNQITAGEYNEYLPSIATDASGRFFIGFDGTEDGTAYYPIFTYSEDGGTTWADGAYFSESLGSKKPDVDSKSSGFYATFDPPADITSQIFIVDARVIDNPTGFYWDFAPDFDSLQDVHIATYTHAGPTDDGAWNWGGLAFTGYNGYSSIVDCPFVLYQYSEQGAVIGWLTNSAGCKHASTDIDLVTNMSYNVYDRDVSGKYQLLVRKDNYGVWTSQGTYYKHPLVTTKTIIGVGNLTYPDVIADSNDVMVVAQSDEAGNQDIVCYYSSNGMSSYNNAIVADDAEDELSPQIAWIKPGVAICTYIRGTEAYFKATEDGGATWSAEARVSDEQIDPVENHAMTITGINGNAYSIWQDGRGDNVDIYWDRFYTVESPNVQIGTVAGGIGKVTMEVKNIGTGPATNVSWSISVKGGILNRINVTTTEIILSLPASGTETVQTDKFIFGLGALTIQLAAGSATASKTGKVFLIFVRNIA
ncbi:MAG: hypothetical protein MUO73_07545 [Thermoplasmata archaeon]|nr:hypothetical protein [Thermoplasmata archaeon]